jgi:hypothetical protein
MDKIEYNKIFIENKKKINNKKRKVEFEQFFFQI